MKKKIGIVADSSSGLSIKDLKEMNIGFCPLLINFSDGTTISDDPNILKDEEFYDRIVKRKQSAKTSQTPLGQMSSIWEETLTKFEQIIFIPLSKGLSGQYNTATMLAKESNFKNKVFVFDSNGVSVINWLLVKKAYQMSLNKKNSVNDIIEALKLISDNYIAFILPYDLNYLVRGGRISKAAAALATMLKINPILSFDGTIDKFDKTRTWDKAIKNTLKEINKSKKAESITAFYIIHAFAEAKAIEKVNKYVKDYGIKNIKIINLANVICAHTGIGTFSFVAFNLTKDKLPKLEE
ncbi:DegV family protein [Spiroplasma endosymbiont of Polydrusus pterygomalis]|uniref:DegV family protein n=1 Tax=Spiroplasma endosymbiont of Polydrusus pterygomalis TaxID=3139327 RepID=UPI003CCACAB6